MNKRVLDADPLRDLTAADLLEQINNNELSLLKSIGADDLRKEMELVGFICRSLVNKICKEKDDGKLRTKTVRILRTVAPAVLVKPFPTSEAPVVIGFNHPSLGEIFRLLYLGFEAYPDKKFLFPVNIPWYESLTPSIEKLKRLGVYITPMITPSTEKKLRKRFGNNEQMLDDIQHYKVIFERRYMRIAKEMAAESCAVFVAPSATRQATVFPDNMKDEDHLHPTMTILARMILKNKGINVNFIPVAVVEPKKNDRKLNLFKEYKIIPCDAFDTEQVAALTDGKRRDLDFEFLKRIDDCYSRERHSAKTGR